MVRKELLAETEGEMMAPEIRHEKKDVGVGIWYWGIVLSGCVLPFIVARLLASSPKAQLIASWFWSNVIVASTHWIFGIAIIGFYWLWKPAGVVLLLWALQGLLTDIIAAGIRKSRN